MAVGNRKIIIWKYRIHLTLGILEGLAPLYARIDLSRRRIARIIYICFTLNSPEKRL